MLFVLFFFFFFFKQKTAYEIYQCDWSSDVCSSDLKGDTASGATKPAELETGAVIQVPLFVEEGQVVKIDTRTGEYIERVR